MDTQGKLIGRQARCARETDPQPESSLQIFHLRLFVCPKIKSFFSAENCILFQENARQQQPHLAWRIHRTSTGTGTAKLAKSY